MPTSPQTHTLSGFLQDLDQFHKESGDRGIVFLLGAGASFSSKIPTGIQLARQWLRQIQEREDSKAAHRSTESWATQANLGPGFQNFDYARVGEFYPQIFERRFGHDPQAAFDSLETLMEAATPSFGYLVLAKILDGPRHKVVLTTNFDSLAADALSMLGMRRPLVCGHESLAGFARKGLKRPIVAQIHRNLLLNPINDAKGTAELADAWKNALGRLLERSLILVVGYGGNDGSLMGYLKAIDLHQMGSTLYWCHLEGETLSTPIQHLLAQQKGVAVPILGFDELMVQLGPRLLGADWVVKALAESIRQRGSAAADQFLQAYEKLTRKTMAATTDPSQTEETKAAGLATLESMEQAEPGKPWWLWALEAEAATTSDEKETVFRQAMQALPESPELTGTFALFMKNIRRDYDEAERLYQRALELDPNHSINTGNFALFMQLIRKDGAEAERLYRQAIELDPNDADITGRFANFMMDFRRNYDEAERLYRRALELDPNNPDNLVNFASIQLQKGEGAEARSLAARAWESNQSAFNQARAEAALYLILLDRIEEKPISGGLARLKGLITMGFKRGHWSFEPIFQAVLPRILDRERPFYRALGDAILDEAKVPDLDTFPAWQETEPADPSTPWSASAP